VRIGVGFAAALLLGGCFAELGLDGTGEPEPMCELGQAACGCYGNGSCDPGLRCVAEIQMCVPADCQAGSPQCTCTPEGTCFDGFSCAGGVCVDPWPQSDTASSETGTDDVTTTTAAPTTGTTDDSIGDVTTDAGESTTLPDPDTGTGETTTSTTTEGGPVCSDEPCGVCVDCVSEPGEACAGEAQACNDEFGCAAAAICLRGCGVKGLCLDECCGGSTSNAAADKAMALNACRANACAFACIDYNDGLCS
jgi:hypothetical protein